jgi:hypothetical protein
MRVIRAAAEAGELPDEEVRVLVQQRITMLSEDEPYDPAIHGYFIVLDSQDSNDAVSQTLGFSVMCNRWDGTHFGEPTFTPSFEMIEEHTSCFEMVFVLSDSGCGVIVFVPKEHVDPDLLAMCRAHAIRSQEPST